MDYLRLPGDAFAQSGRGYTRHHETVIIKVEAIFATTKIPLVLADGRRSQLRLGARGVDGTR
jgi:hypothetical protein